MSSGQSSRNLADCGTKGSLAENADIRKNWDSEAGFFKVITQVKREDEIKTFDFAGISLEHNVMEEIGYIPWNFGISGKEHDYARI